MKGQGATNVRRSDRVMVTGAAGFIGSHVVDALLKRGNTVVAVDRRSQYADPVAAMNLTDVAAHPALTAVTADLATADVAKLLIGCDTVVHLAAVTGVRTSWGGRFPEYVKANLLGTQRVAEACWAAGVRRLVVASSSSVYGARSAPSRETDSTWPVSPYGVTKLAAEQLCLAYAVRADNPTSVVVLRYFTVYGPRQRADMALGRVLASALTGVPFPLYGDGQQRREFTYVSDAVAATIAATDAPVPGAVVVNVGGGTTASMRDVIDLAGQVTGRPVPIAATRSQPGDALTTAADLSQARHLLDYRPKVELRDGIQQQFDWLMDLAPHQRTAVLA
ncbi:MAG: NAD-dependent epimerase/dehydratase family protein, partial [Natronosporangium sp.]